MKRFDRWFRKLTFWRQFLFILSVIICISPVVIYQKVYADKIDWTVEQPFWKFVAYYGAVPEPTPIPDPQKELIEKLTIERNTLSYQLEQENLSKISMNNQICIINKRLKGKLANKGHVYYKASRSQHPEVSTFLMVAITLRELGEGCNSIAIKTAYNVGGLSWSEKCGYPKDKVSGWYRDYTNRGGVDGSIWDMAGILSTYYIKAGKTTIADIGKKYAPPSDVRNGMYGMNNDEWPESVTTYYNTMINEAKKMGGAKQ